MNSARPFFWLLLTLAAAARLLLQMAAMPPYAGLDEIYHVAALRFTAAEGRMPRMGEPSIPRYLASSIAGDPAALPAFGVVGERWPEVVASRRNILVDSGALPPLKPWSGANYEAQQPSLYYRLAAPLALGATSPLAELRRWRALSVICALLVVIGAALIGWRLFGEAGLVAAVLIVSLPTWETLLVRASNDAFACALLALALAASFNRPSSSGGWIVEALLWASAVAVKLYSWPVVVILPLLWRSQRAARSRWLLVSLAIAASAVLTIVDLHLRTNNPLGLFAFDAPSRTAGGSVPIDYATMVKVFIASAAWTSGQHWDALRPLAIALYGIPVLAAIAFALMRYGRTIRVQLTALAVIAAAFALAQVINAAGYIRLARAAGSALPAGGKEGWYWYVLAPIAVTMLLGLVIEKLARPASVVLISWLLIWDLLITEGALFHDYAGATSPLHSSVLFRWGPLLPPLTADLAAVAVGPFARGLIALRFLHLVSAGVLIAVVLRSGRKPVATSVPAL